MTRKGKFILAGVAATTVGLAAAGAMAQRGHYWEGHKWDGKERHFRHHGGGAGLLGLPFGGPGFRVCGGNVAERADHMMVRIEHRVKPTEEQKTTFEEFKTAARAAATKLSEACPPRPERAEDGKRQRPTPIERLAQTQAGLETSLEALKSFRPAAEKFYASLSDEQKQKLERRGRGDKGKGHWKRDRGPRDGKEDGPSPEHGPEGSAPDDKT
ncbi:Spy/CpxP family protein refolding chaperone [Hyphomicrobium sp. CS1GBMeth3]|uniref:Spy/CpxP family protein refolding chaperone n=1 Tax=Hyphomicrobium sp. CS1GBMeth3 TaxID=1892845 RepID=UPI000931998A|nr:Spy/CpxP family protein refolding chaperone [Hyphomicrobium sp. CS1GBMeth3]